MLVRLVEYNWTKDDDTGMQNPNFIKAYNFKDIDKIIEFIKSIIDHDVRVGDEWYTIQDYIWVFPKDEDSVPCLDVYCCGY